MNEQFHRFNENLMQKLNPAADRAFGEPARKTSKLLDGKTFTETTEYNGQGHLVVQVTLARGAIPVQGANVTVTQAGDETAVMAELVTDQSGRTDRVPLPAPKAEYSQSPGGSIRPYSIYNIKVEFPGYYIEDAINVPVFDKVDSIQPIALLPLSEGSAPREEIFVDESEAQTL